jgi:gamma-glutamyltranspeptidase
VGQSFQGLPVLKGDPRARGHDVTEESSAGRYGGAQLIMRLEAGGYTAASDHRKDGQAVGYWSSLSLHVSARHGFVGDL